MLWLVLWLVLWPRQALAADPPLPAWTAGGSATNRRAEAGRAPFPSPFWLATQLLPSPGVATGDGQVGFDLRWQLTPLLYSFGVNRRVSGWRAFVVEPYVRHSGSVELFVSPELMILAGHAAFFARPGARVYFPVLEHGEVLSVSLALSYQRVGTRDAVAIEAGAYILFGILGFQVSCTPAQATPGQTIATLRIRYF